MEGGKYKGVGYLCMIPERKTDNVCSLYKHKAEKGRGRQETDNKDARQSEAAKSSGGNERDVYPRRDHVAVCLCFSPRF